MRGMLGDAVRGSQVVTFEGRQCGLRSVKGNAMVALSRCLVDGEESNVTTIHI